MFTITPPRLTKRLFSELVPWLFLCATATAHAQTAWPSRPVTIVVPFAAGGGTDIGARILAQRLSQMWGQAVVIDNKDGAGGNVGTQSINPTLYKKLNYNPDTSFVPLGQFAELPFVLAVTTSLPVKNVKELVDMAKAQPEKLTYASSGNSGSPHLSAET